MKKVLGLTITLLALTTATPSYADDNVTVEITNITHGTWFTPVLVVAHNRDADLFEIGEVASDALAKVAEAGDVTDLQGIAEGLGASVAVASTPAGPIGPGETVTVEVDSANGNRRISLVGMLLPTNDGFVGLDSIRIPRENSRRTLFALGYDAGSEINDEIVNGGGFNEAGIPADPGGNNGAGGSGVTSIEPNTNIHIHPGVVGDSNPSGGMSDLDPAVHSWQNPVASIVISR